MTERKNYGFAVSDAIRLNDCFNELADIIADGPQLADDEEYWHFDYSAIASNNGQNEGYAHRCGSRDIALAAIRKAITDGGLPIWAYIGTGEIIVDHHALADLTFATFRSGTYQPTNRLLDGAKLADRPLWIKEADWQENLAGFLRGRYGDDPRNAGRLPESKNSKFHSCSADADQRQWLRVSKAIRILHRILKTRLAGQEPAPWFDPPADPFDAECENATHRHRRTARTSLIMRRALLAGDLTSYLVKDDCSHPLPGWAWENASAAESAFNFNWFPLNPLLEHGLGEFGDWRCFVSRAELQAWLSRPEIAEIGDLPTLPAPFDHDVRPDQLSYREPPERPFVELTQALTWIAFAVSLNRDEFSFMESCGFGPFAESGWPDGFRDAMAGFADQASAGNIRVRGRYVANYSDHTAAAQANTDYLSDTQLRDFARFDSLHGGLERGAGLIWGEDLLEHALNGKQDGWREVEVCRADLMKVFSKQDDIAQALTQTIPTTLPDIGPVMGLNEALSWLAHDRPSYDYLWRQNGAGDLEFRDPSGAVVERAEDGSPPQALQAQCLASRRFHRALQQGSLASYVAPESGVALHVPRTYWNGVNPESLHHIYRGMVPEDQGAGCPVLLSRKAIDEWRATMPVKEESEKPKLTHDQVVEWCRQWIKSGKGNGMDRAWDDFKLVKDHQGLSRDDVFRPAWREAKTH